MHSISKTPTAAFFGRDWNYQNMFIKLHIGTSSKHADSLSRFVNAITVFFLIFNNNKKETANVNNSATYQNLKKNGYYTDVKQHKHHDYSFGQVYDKIFSPKIMTLI
jgi:hypothetical protein